VSTQINVTVGSGGLSDKARQLQAAARQAQLEKERQQRLEAQGNEQRNAKLEAEGKAPDGSPLYGARFKQPQIDRRPAAFRGAQPAGMAMGWHFDRLKEQPTTFIARATVDGPCAEYPDIGGGQGRWTSKAYTTHKIYSGSGNVEYTFDEGFDFTGIWSALPAEGQDMSQGPFGDSVNVYTGGAPGIGSFGPTNPSFPDVNPVGSGSTQFTQWELWIPVRRGFCIYYYYKQRLDAIQKRSSQPWMACGAVSPTLTLFSNIYNIESPVLTTNTTEVCLLVGERTIKEITPPIELKARLLSAVSQWSILSYDRIIPSGVYEGVYRDPFSAPGYIWSATTPTASLSSLLAGRTLKYSISSPLDTFTAQKYVTTAGIFSTLVSDPQTDYATIQEAAPSVSASQTVAGFASANTWEQVYDAATTFAHESDKRQVKPNTLAMASSKLARPTESLVYTSPEGFTLTDPWSTQVALAYDWANSAFCAQQLLALGFTTADLTP